MMPSTGCLSSGKHLRLGLAPMPSIRVRSAAAAITRRSRETNLCVVTEVFRR